MSVWNTGVAGGSFTHCGTVLHPSKCHVNCCFKHCPNISFFDDPLLMANIISFESENNCVVDIIIFTLWIKRPREACYFAN